MLIRSLSNTGAIIPKNQNDSISKYKLNDKRSYDCFVSTISFTGKKDIFTKLLKLEKQLLENYKRTLAFDPDFGFARHVPELDSVRTKITSTLKEAYINSAKENPAEFIKFSIKHYNKLIRENNMIQTKFMEGDRSADLQYNQLFVQIPQSIIYDILLGKDTLYAANPIEAITRNALKFEIKNNPELLKSTESYGLSKYFHKLLKKPFDENKWIQNGDIFLKK